MHARRWWIPWVLVLAGCASGPAARSPAHTPAGRSSSAAHAPKSNTLDGRRIEVRHSFFVTDQGSWERPGDSLRELVERLGSGAPALVRGPRRGVQP